MELENNYHIVELENTNGNTLKKYGATLILSKTCMGGKMNNERLQMTFETSGDQVDPGETRHCLDSWLQTKGGVFLIIHFEQQQQQQ